jgi:hypothetical protein
MRKTDFQMEDELAGNLRQLKAKTGADLLRERYDDVFRRNLVEPNVPEGAGVKKRKLKHATKMHNPIVEACRKGQKKFKKKEEAYEKSKKAANGDWLKDDLIVL